MSDHPKGYDMKKAVAYYRVSTGKQGESGLGLAAQEKAVRDYATANQYQVMKEHIEIESGKNNTRPLLLQALECCKQEKATLLIAKLDRLGRNVAFISRLLEAGVDFKAVDNPYADKLIVHIMAAFAEHERDQISQRTKAALQAAKKRGVPLGKYGRDVLSKKNKSRAIKFAQKMEPIIENIKRQKTTTIRGIANELNRMKVPTYRNTGQHWHPSAVHQLVKRINNLKTK